MSSQVATLEILDQRKADYIEATEKMQSYITNFENRFPADILPEDSIMMVKTLEDYTRTEVANIAFGSEAEVVYTPAADAATTTHNLLHKMCPLSFIQRKRLTNIFNETSKPSSFCCLPIITIGVVDYRHCNQKNLKIYLSTLHKSV